MLKRSEIKRKLKEIKPILTSEFNVKRIGIFGSYAKSEQNKNSDIDMLVEFSKPIGWKFFTLEKYLEDLFKTKIDLVTKRALKKQLKKAILNQVIFI